MCGEAAQPCHVPPNRPPLCHDSDNRESRPEEMDDDDNNGLEYLFWISPEPRRSKRTLSVLGHYAVLAGHSPGSLVYGGVETCRQPLIR
jgi:hypothetical protein